MDCGYYDCKLNRFVMNEEIKQNMSKEKKSAIEKKKTEKVAIILY